MIEAVELSYLQSWKYGLFEFVPGVNIITGTSDKGKTGIIRGIRLAAENEPRRNVNALVSTFKKKKKTPTSVTIQFSDSTVTLERTGTQNIYILNGDDKHPYKALSGNVPDTVAKAINMTSLNFQLQHEPYFLLNESAGKVAKKFNELANLQIMDAALVAANGRCRTIASALKVSEGLIEGLDNKVNGLNWLDSAQKPLKRALAIQNEIDTINDAYLSLSNKIKRLRVIDSELESFEILLEAEDKIKEAFDLHKQLKDTTDTLSEFGRKLTRVKLIDKLIKKNEKWDGADELIEESLKLNEKITGVHEEHYNLHLIIKKLKTINHNSEKTTNDLDNAEYTFSDLLKQAGVCPLCGSEV